MTAGTVLSSSNPKALIFVMENGSIISRKDVDKIEFYLNEAGNIEYLIIRKAAAPHYEIFNMAKIGSIQIPDQMQETITTRPITVLHEGIPFGQ